MKPTPAERDNLVNELVSARRRAGFSQTDVAERAKVSRSFVQRIEERTRNMTPNVLRAYGVLLGLDVDALLLRWGIVPEDVVTGFQNNPQLLHMVRSVLTSEREGKMQGLLLPT